MFDLSSGAGLRAARQSLGLTQAQLASYLGMKQPQIYVLEARRALTAAMQSRIAEVLSVHSKGVHASPSTELEAAYDEILKAVARHHTLALRALAAGAASADPDSLDALLAAATPR